MYKDVWKKILAVVLTVAVIAGAVELPKVARAAVPDELEIEVDEEQYNGTVQTPQVRLYDKSTGQLLEEGSFSVINPDSTIEMKEVGNYTIRIQPISGYGYTWDAFEYNFKIIERKMYGIRVEPTGLFTKYKQSGAYTEDDLGIEKVWVTFSDGNEEAIDKATEFDADGFPTNGYKIANVSATGVGDNVGTYDIQVKTKNIVKKTIHRDDLNGFTVAYPVQAVFSDAYKTAVGATEETYTTGGETYSYTSIPYRKGLKAFQMNSSSTRLSGISFVRYGTANPIDLLSGTYSGISVKFYRYDFATRTKGEEINADSITDAGDYVAVITTGSGTFSSGNGLYFGTTELPFKVAAKKIDLLDGKTTVTDLQSGEYVYRVDTSASPAKAVQDKVPELTYNDGVAQYYDDSDFEVIYEGRKLEKGTDYTITYSPEERTRLVGVVGVNIQGIGNYNGSIYFEYRIMSDLDIQFNPGNNFTAGSGEAVAQKTYQFNNTDDVPNFSIYNKAGIEVGYYSRSEGLKDNGKFTVTYQYYNRESGTYENVAKSAAEFTSAGLKRIVVNGAANTEYANSAEVSLVFEVLPANINNGSEDALAQRFKIDYDNTDTYQIPDRDYSGEEIKNIIKGFYDMFIAGDGNNVKYSMVEGTDYDITYENNVNAGTASFTITGKGNYTGTFKKTFTIKKVSLANATTSNLIYNGSRQYPTIKVGDNVVLDGKRVTNAVETVSDDGTVTGITIPLTEYTVVISGWDGVSAQNNIAVTITANANATNYFGSKTLTFNVAKAKLDESQIDYTGTIEWNGVSGTPTKVADPVVRDLGSNASTPLVLGTDYTLTWSEDTTAKKPTSGNASATITVTPTNPNYTSDPVTLTYTITPRDITKSNRVTISYESVEPNTSTTPAIWTPSGIKVVDEETGVTLTEDTDYTISYKDDQTVTETDGDRVTGETGYIVVTGKGSYAGSNGTVTKSFPCGYDITNAKAVLNGIEGKTYTFANGVSYPTNTKDAVTSLTYDGTALDYGTDFVIQYATNSQKASIQSTTGLVDDLAVVDDDDFDKAREEICSHAGTITVTVTGIGKYYGTRTFTYTIAPKPLTSDMVTIKFVDAKLQDKENNPDYWESYWVFKGEYFEPELDVSVTAGSIKLTEGEDYQVTWKDNYNATRGSKEGAYAVVEGIGDYSTPTSSDTKAKTDYYPIAPLDLAKATIEVESEDMPYYGGQTAVHTPAVTVSKGTYVDEAPAGEYNSAQGSYTVRRDKKISDNINSGTWVNTGLTYSLNTGDLEAALEADNGGIAANRETFVTRNDSYGGGHLILTADNNGNFTGRVVKFFDILPISLSKGTVSSELLESEGVEVGTPPDMSRFGATFTSDYYGMTDFALTYDFDYTYGGTTGTEIGVQTLTIQGKNNFDGEGFINYRSCYDISKLAEVVDTNYLYDKASLSVTKLQELKTANGGDLSKLTDLREKTSGTDTVGRSISNTYYTVEIQPDENIGTKNVYVKGNPDQYYTGTLDFQITLTGDLTADTISVTVIDKEMTYTGKELVPTVRVTDNGKALLKGTDYYIKEEKNDSADNVLPGKGQITIQGMGSYAGERSFVTEEFDIKFPMDQTKISLSYGSKTVGEDQTLSVEYTGQEIKPSVAVTYEVVSVKESTNEDGDTINVIDPDEKTTYTKAVEGTDYSVTYGTNTNAGKGTAGGSVTVAALANGLFTPTGGYKRFNFDIEQRDIDLVRISEVDLEYEYTGNQIKPSPSVRDELLGADLTLNKDYRVSYGTNLYLTEDDGTNMGTVTVTGTGNYTGTREVTFKVVRADISTTLFSADDVSAYYTGLPQAAPGIALDYKDIFNQDHRLTEGTDFYVKSYVGSITGYNKVSGSAPTPAAAPTDKDTYTVTIQGMGNFTGARTLVYTILTKPLTDGTIELKILRDVDSEEYVGDKVASYEYTGAQIKPKYQVKDTYTNKILTEGVDYDLVESDIYINAQALTGDAANWPRVTVRGRDGNYTGEVSCYYTIRPREISAYPPVRVSYGFDATSPVNHMDFTGDVAQPSITITDTTSRAASQVLVRDSGDDTGDYKVEFKAQNDVDCIYAGRVDITITGMNNYTGTVTERYYIGTDISAATTSLLGATTSVYDGLFCELDASKVTVNSGRLGLTGDEYDIKVYKDAIYDADGELNTAATVDIDKILDVGTYYIVVDGVPERGTYAATPAQGARYTVTPKSIFNATIGGFPETVYYTGDYITIKGLKVVDPELPIAKGSTLYRSEQLEEGVDYYIDTTTQYKNPGKAVITIKGIGNYDNEAHAYYTIESNALSGGDLDDGSSSGTGITAENGVTIDAGDITVYYDGDGQYMKWTGKEVIPSITISYGSRSLVQGTEYTVRGVNNINAGVATLVITGTGGFSGDISKKFNIKADLSGATIAPIPDQIYTGSELTPTTTISCGGNILSLGTDYTAAYSNNVNMGVASIEYKAVDGSYYYGTNKTTFNISNSAGGMSVTGYASSYTYSGYAISPELLVTMNGTTLSPGTDYNVTYANNINVGNATATVTGKGAYSGTKTISFAIVAKNISTCNAQVSGGTTYEYTGGTQTPAIVLTDLVSGKVLTKGTDYSVSYSNNTAPGTASIEIKALSSNYTGTKVVTFSIASAAVTGLKTSSVTYKSMKLSWTKQSYADGYQICDQNNKVIATTKNNSYKVSKLTSYKTYKFKVRSYVENKDGSISYGAFSTLVSKRTKLATPTLKLKAKGNGKVRLSWTKARLATGYEIYYSTTKNGVYTKLKTVSASSKRAWTDTGLAKGEKYYYTIRAYRKVNGTKVYSSYYKIKAITVK